MAQSKKQANEIRNILLKSGTISANSFNPPSRVTDPAISRHNAIIARRRELNKVTPATVTTKATKKETSNV